jgi:galactonate dehydratase
LVWQAKGIAKMKITEIRVHLVAIGFRNAIFTEIETDAGITGISETVMKRRSQTIAECIGELKRFLIGKDPTCIEDLYEKLYRDSFWVGGPMHSTAISAVEIALWDILGKELNVPVYRLLGGPTRKAIQVYCHCAAGATPEEAANHARACLTDGFRAAKTTLPIWYGAGPSKSGYSGTGGQIDPRYKETEYLSPQVFADIYARFAAMRDAVGSEMDLSVDCHGRLSPANAVRLAETLADLQLLFIEEPIPPENVDAMAWVAQRSPVPIAAGERIVTIYGAREVVEKQAVAILQPDVVNCGGLNQAKKIAAMAEAHYISIAPHNPNGPVATITSAHLAASIPNFFLLETVGLKADLDLFAEVTDPPPVIENGLLCLPDGPGLGIDLKKDAFSRFPYQPFEATR